MLKTTALAHYKSVRAIAEAARVSTVAVWKWGTVVPLVSARRLGRNTQGELKVVRSLYRDGRPLKGEELQVALASLNADGCAERNDDAAVAR